MASSPEIHMFKKSAIAAGTPEDYYLNPSDNLWKIASDWSVVEHEDVLELSFNLFGIGDRVILAAKENINIEIDVENKKKAARFDHQDGMKKFSIEMNPKFLKLDYMSDASYRVSPDGYGSLFVNKLEESLIWITSDKGKWKVV